MGDVNADDAARLTHDGRGAENVGTRPRAEVEYLVAWLERGEVEVVPHSGERRQGVGRNGVQQFARIPEVLGEAPAHLEVQIRLLLAGNVTVHVLDLRLQPLSIYERARVELRQGLRLGHLVLRADSPGAHRVPPEPRACESVPPRPSPSR